MKHIAFSIILLFVLHGCITVKLQSVLPEQAYYSLDTVNLEPTCNKFDNSLGLNITVLSPYDGKDILLYSEGSEIRILEKYKWIDLPKNMIRNSIIKSGLNQCLRIEQNPPLGQKLNTLRVSVNELYLSSEEEQIDSKQNKNVEYSGYIYLNYELVGPNYNRIKSGVVFTTTKNHNPAKALQEALNESVLKILNEIK